MEGGLREHKPEFLMKFSMEKKLALYFPIST